MDLSITNKTPTLEVNAAFTSDETNMSSGEGNCGTDTSPPVYKEVEIGHGVMRRTGVDHTIRPYATSRQNRTPISVVTAEENNEIYTLPYSEEHCVVAPLPDPVTPVAEESVPCPEENTPTMDNFLTLTKRQMRRENAKQRNKMFQDHPQSSADETEAKCSNFNSRKRTLAASADSSQTCTEVKRTKVEVQAEPSTERVAIIPVTFPAEQILQSHIAAIQEAIITHLVDTPDPLPHITLGNLMGGALFCNCVGRDSVNWLSETVSQNKIAGLVIKVVGAKDLPKPIKMAWKTKIVGVQDIKLLLKVLQRYNPSLNTDQWKVVDTSLDNTSSRRIILVDRASADVIRNAGYQLYSGIDISTFKVLEDSERGKNTECNSKDLLCDPI